jgi:predicted MFS family arabinose efflux permease
MVHKGTALKLTLFRSPNIATAIGPIFGGALAEFPGWRWIFWLLSILSGTCFLLIAFFFSETARSVVGNGSTNASGLHRTIFSYVQAPRSSPPPDTSEGAENVVTLPPENATRKGFHVPNPVQSLRLLWAKDCILIVLIFGIFYMNLSCVQASTSALFINLYGVSELKAGLVYLPSGIGSIIGAYGAGEDARLALTLPHLALSGTSRAVSCFFQVSIIELLTESF